VLGCGVRHDMDLSGLGSMFEEFCISLNAQRRNILPHESLGGRSPFSILFSTKTPPQHVFKPFGCHTTILKPEAALLKKTLGGVSLASILKPLCLAANLAISSGYHLKNVSHQQCTPFSAISFSQLAVSHHEFTIFLLHCHQLTANCLMIIYLSHITPRHLSIHGLLLPSHTHIQATTINRAFRGYKGGS